MGNNKTILKKSEKILIIMVVAMFVPILICLFFYLSNEGRNIKAQYYGKVINKSKKVLFIGDSLIEYCNFSRYEGTEDYLNRGIAGLRSDELLNNIDALLSNNQVKDIVILIGTNDILVEKDDEIIADRIFQIAKIAQNRTQARVYVQSLYPINKKDKFANEFFVKERSNERINSINQKLKEKIEGTDINYININEKIRDEKGNLRQDLTVDGLHVNAKAYDIIIKEISKNLKNGENL